MHIYKKKDQKGFTLMETMVTIGIFSVLMLGVIELFILVLKVPSQQLVASGNVDQARRGLSTFVNEMRNAGPGNNGGYALSLAGDSQIVFYSNYGATGSVFKRVRYYLSGNTLYKGVVIPTGSPLAYNLGSEVITTVQNNVVNGSIPVFYYYDGNYDGSTDALAQPVNVTTVTFVKINLTILKQTTATSTSAFTINTGVGIRSLKTNLGN